MTKKKIPEFSETKYAENDFDEESNIDTELEKYKKLSAKYFTKNRLDNAISKIGLLMKTRMKYMKHLLTICCTK